jgi:hypothetical protein
MPGMTPRPPGKYNAVAAGSTREFDVEIDEASDEANNIQMAINARGWSFRFALSAREDVRRMLSFLHEHTGHLAFAEVPVGSFHGVPVLLVKDDEFGDRFWLRALCGGGHMVEFVLAGDHLAEFMDAVRQTVEDLET